MAQYEYNQDLDVTVRDLETTRQGNKESFAEYLSRWREKTAKMVQRPSEKDQIRMLINTFAKVFDMGTRIEEAVQEWVIKKEEQPNRYRRPNYG